jgi:hypothetical protein
MEGHETRWRISVSSRSKISNETHLYDDWRITVVLSLIRLKIKPLWPFWLPAKLIKRRCEPEG